MDRRRPTLSLRRSIWDSWLCAWTEARPNAVTELNAAEDELEHGWPHALPDGSIVFTVSQRGRDPHLEVLSLKGERTRLRVPIIGQAQFVETGHLIYSFLGNLMAVRFDVDRSAIDGVPAVIAKGIQTSRGFGALGRSGLRRFENRHARLAAGGGRRREEPARSSRAGWQSIAPRDAT